MNSRISKLLIVVVALLVIVQASVQASAKQTSKAVVVDSPSDLPPSAQRPSEAMYMRSFHGRVVLYLEQDQGRKLAMLDVTDPQKIRAVGEVSIDAPSPFDFAQDLRDSVLIHYRNHSGFAVINFKNYKEPLLKQEPDYLHPSSVQSNGSNTLLFVSSTASASQTAITQKEVVSVADPTDSKPVATIRGVFQRLDRPESGTIFLLNEQGLSVIRCIATEKDYEQEMFRPQVN
jgi:hypothetical protein